MWKIFKYNFSDLLRGRWSILNFAFYFAVGLGLLYLSNDIYKAVISLSNIVLALVPLSSLVLGVIYMYDHEDFIALILTKPLKRTSVYLGHYFALIGSNTLSFTLGLGIPFLIMGIWTASDVMYWLNLWLCGLLLSYIFTAFAMIIALHFTNKVKGFSVALLIWLFLTLIYDGLLLISLLIFEEYPVERFALWVSMFNPIDLSRILITLQLDVAAYMGYTGAIFHRFFGSIQGILVVVAVLLLWVIFPIWWFIRLANRKNY